MYTRWDSCSNSWVRRTDPCGLGRFRSTVQEAPDCCRYACRHRTAAIRALWPRMVGWLSMGSIEPYAEVQVCWRRSLLWWLWRCKQCQTRARSLSLRLWMTEGPQSGNMRLPRKACSTQTSRPGFTSKPLGELLLRLPCCVRLRCLHWQVSCLNCKCKQSFPQGRCRQAGCRRGWSCVSPGC